MRLACVCALAAGCAAPQLERHAFECPAMGTRFRIVLYADDAATAERASTAAFERIEALERTLTDYDETSELSRLGAATRERAPTAPVLVSHDLYLLLARADELARLTGGAFDVTVGPLTHLWRRALRRGELPGEDALARARAAVGFEALELDPRGGTARLLRADMRLDPGGIGKGFALDAALAVLRAHGVERALVDGGGDLALGAAPPGRAGWRIELRPFDEGERTFVELAHAGLATSGDAFRFVEIDGIRYSHVVDPRSGLGLTRRTAATVLAGDATAADALATACCVLGPDAAVELAGALPGVEARVAAQGGPVRSTSGFGAILTSAPHPPPTDPSP